MQALSKQILRDPGATVPTHEAKRRQKEFVRRLHEAPLSSKWYFPLLVMHIATWVLAAWSWIAGLWTLTVLLWIVAAHFNHSKLMAYHEAAHQTLSKNRLCNELRGIITGLFCGVPLAAYRVVHHTHHAHLGSNRDGELWPFTDPAAPRWLRLLVLAAGLVAGPAVTPLLFLRGALVPRVNARVRRRMVAEYVLLVAAWSAALTAVAVFGWWEAFLVGFMVPAFLTGLFQTLRTLVEHLGLFGDSPLTLSRTIVAEGALSRFISTSMMHVDQHGPHHAFGRVPHHRLPDATRELCGGSQSEAVVSVFRSYLQAGWDMLPHLLDPKFGPQWKQSETAARPACRTAE